MTKDVSEQSALVKSKRDIEELLVSAHFKKQLVDALPNTLKPDRMVRLAVTMLKKNTALLKCDHISIMACVVECAQLGLELEGVLGHAYLVPFGGTCTLIVGYRGFAHLMYQSGMYADVGAEVVRSKDEFRQILGTRREIVHVPGDIPEKDDPDTWRGAYGFTVSLAHNTAFAYLQKQEILLARARSKSWQAYKRDGKESPWHTDPAEMWKKTAIRRLAKRSQTSTSDQRAPLLRAVMLDEYAERKGLLVPTLAGFEVNPDPPEPRPDEEPLTPTAEIVDEQPKGKQYPPGSLERSTKSPKKETPSKDTGVPKAQIPKGPIAEQPAEDPFITTAEQTDIYNKALKVGWKIPDEVKSMLTKRFHIDSLKLVRRSQLPAILRAIESGT
jgi:recombination protein RecT